MNIRHVDIADDYVNVSFTTASVDEGFALVQRIRALTELIKQPQGQDSVTEGAAAKPDVPQVTHSEKGAKSPGPIVPRSVLPKEARESNGASKDPIPEDLPKLGLPDEETNAKNQPRKKRGRPRMTEEQKAAAKAERERIKAEEEKKAAEEEAADEEEEALEEPEVEETPEPEEEVAEDDADFEDEEEEEKGDEAKPAAAAPPVSEDVIARMRTMGKLRDILNTLKDEGYNNGQAMAEVCEAIKADVPVLSRIAGLEQRVVRAASVMGLDG